MGMHIRCGGVERKRKVHRGLYNQPIDASYADRSGTQSSRFKRRHSVFTTKSTETKSTFLICKVDFFPSSHSSIGAFVSVTCTPYSYTSAPT